MSFEGRGSKSAAIGDSFVVVKIYWKIHREAWYDGCVDFGDDGEFPVASKTKGSVVMAKACCSFHAQGNGRGHCALRVRMKKQRRAPSKGPMPLSF